MIFLLLLIFFLCLTFSFSEEQIGSFLILFFASLCLACAVLFVARLGSPAGDGEPETLPKTGEINPFSLNKESF
jgi:hypothetical protein